MDFILFWLAKFAVELGLALVVIVFIFLYFLPGYIKQQICKHESYFENGQCHGICRNCGKDLGFIGSLKGIK